MMTSLQINAVCMTGLLWGASTDDKWIPPAKNQWCGALMFLLLLTRTSCWTNSQVANDMNLAIRGFIHHTKGQECSLVPHGISTSCLSELPILLKGLGHLHILYPILICVSISSTSMTSPSWLYTQLFSASKWISHSPEDQGLTFAWLSSWLESFKRAESWVVCSGLSVTGGGSPWGRDNGVGLIVYSYHGGNMGDKLVELVRH